ncbi:DNA double-strand break repair helicase HerA [uncultured archaeon]|nr:DNA double-strand break repair helicase HerA [uncultured archaeon]
MFALSRLGTAEAQAVYIESFLRTLYESMLGMPKSPMPTLFIVVEEAGKLKEGSMLSRIAAEGRKYGIGIIAVTQRAKALDSEIRSNAELLIAFYQREPEELNYLANLIAGGNELNRFAEVKKALRSLGKGSALVLNNRSEPQRVRFAPYLGADKSLSHEMIRSSRRAVSRETLFAGLKEMGFEEQGVSERLASLLGSGVLQDYDVSVPGYSGTWYIALPRNSAEHDVMVNLISRHLSSNGIRNSVYNNSFGPDVIAYPGRARLAVEYETGLKREESTRRMVENRKKSYGEVIMVLNDSLKGSYSDIERVRAITASEFFAPGFAESLKPAPAAITRDPSTERTQLSRP